MEFMRRIIATQSSLNDGLIGALLGALVGGVLALLGSFWVAKKQAKAQAEMNRRETIYKPLYDELKRIQDHILPVNPFPTFIAFKKGSQTIMPHPQYGVWGEIKLDSRLLETPKALVKQMEELYLKIEGYLTINPRARDEVRNVLNEVLAENNQQLCSIINVGDSLIPCVFQDNGNGIYDIAMRYANVNLDEETKGKINAAVHQKCTENQLMLDMQKSYNDYVTVQRKAIDLLRKLIQRSMRQSY